VQGNVTRARSILAELHGPVTIEACGAGIRLDQHRPRAAGCVRRIEDKSVAEAR
jgi:hypothetical protein